MLEGKNESREEGPGVGREEKKERKRKKGKKEEGGEGKRLGEEVKGEENAWEWREEKI